MLEKFNTEIISPERKIFSSETISVTVPAFEGQMSFLKNHISLITFLRPGLITVETEKENIQFFIEEGTVEFTNNNLLILTSSAKNKKELNGKEILKIIEEGKKLINNINLSDKEKYILSYKINTLEELVK
mgnify:CR=1 FL=1